MTDIKQKIIFDVPEDTTSARIMLDILEKNGVEDAEDDLVLSPENSKLLFFSNTIKDFFDKKNSEESLVATLQNKLKITKENATEILKDIKEKLIPFAKKITIPDDKEQGQTKPPEIFNVSDTKIKPVEDIIGPIEEKIKNKSALPPKKIRKPIISEEIDKPVPQTRQPRGPDNYREPIE